MSRAAKPKVSVIIPAYNTEAYLCRSLDSVVGQTLREIEIICIDDASTDGTPEILCEYAARDNRITCIRFSRNQGVSAARNAGMAVARGDYLGFVDSDDTIDPHFYENLSAKAVATGALIVKGELQWVEEDGTVRGLPRKDVQQDRLAFRDFFYSGIYNTDFLRKNGISFPLGIVNHEDATFLVTAVSLVPNVETVDNVFYYYLRRANSTYTEVFTPEQFLSVLESLEIIITFFNEHALDENDYVRLCARYIAMGFWLHHQAASECGDDVVTQCRRAAKKLYQMCLHKEAIIERLAAEDPLCVEGILHDTDRLSGKTRKEQLFARLRSRTRPTTTKTTI